MSASDMSAAGLVRYDHAIRLTQYRSRAATLAQAKIDEFIAAWKESSTAPHTPVVDQARKVVDMTTPARADSGGHRAVGFILERSR